MHATMTDHVSCAIVPYDHSGQPYFQQSYVPYGGGACGDMFELCQWNNCVQCAPDRRSLK